MIVCVCVCVCVYTVTNGHTYFIFWCIMTFLSNVAHDRFELLVFINVVSAYEIIKLKGYTSWAIGIMVSTLCNAILRNQRQLYTLSTNAQACHCHLGISQYMHKHS